jgi:antitoxin component YwqK of YwqJK toxin-antitoxin module
MFKLSVLFAPLFLIFLSACSEPEPRVDFSELVKRDGIFYQKFATKPFNGEVVGWIQGRVVNGRWSGSVLQFTKDGNLSIKENYVDGVLNGEQLFYGDDSLRLTEIFINGEKVKATRLRDGVITSISNYRNSVPHGVYEVFYPNGNLVYRLLYENGKRVEDTLDVFSSDGKTHLKVPIYRNDESERQRIYADGLVKIVGNDNCAVEYEEGRNPVLNVALEFEEGDSQATERNRQRLRCTDLIEKIIDGARLKNYVVENLFSDEN